MIELHIDIKTERDFDLEHEAHKATFTDFDSFAVYVMAEMNAWDEKVYVLAYGGDENGIVSVDHLTCNIVDNLLTQFKGYYDKSITKELERVFIFAETNYNDAYKLATDMKESTGMLDFQVNPQEDKADPTVKNGGIDVTSLKN